MNYMSNLYNAVGVSYMLIERSLLSKYRLESHGSTINHSNGGRTIKVILELWRCGVES